MQYYSIEDILEAYSISKATLKTRIKKGIINAQKLVMSRENPNFFKFIIPETELPKLDEFKICEPSPSTDAQPDFFIKRWEEQDKQEEEERVKFEAFQAKMQKHQDYHEYILSEEWQKKRLAVFKRDNYQCQRCGSAKNLCVHHLSYARLGKDDEILDLITLCRECHSDIHYYDINTHKRFQRSDDDDSDLAFSLDFFDQ